VGGLAAVNLNVSRFWSDDISLYTHALESAPESAVTLRYLGAALLRQQRAADAVPYLAKALRGDSNDYYVHLNLAECHRGLGDLQEATVHLRAAISLNPGFPEAYMHLAGVAVLQHRLQEAEAAMRRALELRPVVTPTTTSYHYLLGTILEEKGDQPGALAEYQADLREDPGSENALARAAHLRARR
jgi:tetratricopeptide (TPR) repeat protein